MPRISNKSTFNDPIGLLEELLALNIPLDILQQMHDMIQEKLDIDPDEIAYVAFDGHVYKGKQYGQSEFESLGQEE